MSLSALSHNEGLPRHRTESPDPQARRITIYTSNDDESRILKAATQIVLTVTPADQSELFISQTPIAWKVFDFPPEANYEITVTWNPGVGFCTATVDATGVVTPQICTRIPPRSGTKLESIAGGYQWSRPTPLENAPLEVFMARNSTRVPRVFALCSVEGSPADQTSKSEPFVHFRSVKSGGSVTVGPPVMLQAYVVSGYKENQLLLAEDRYRYILTSWLEGTPEPVDLRTIGEEPTFLLYSDRGGSVALEILQDSGENNYGTHDNSTQTHGMEQAGQWPIHYADALEHQQNVNQVRSVLRSAEPPGPPRSTWHQAKTVSFSAGESHVVLGSSTTTDDSDDEHAGNWVTLQDRGRGVYPRLRHYAVATMSSFRRGLNRDVVSRSEVSTPPNTPPPSHVSGPKEIRIRTSVDDESRVLKMPAQIALTITPVDQSELFVSQAPIAWKVLDFPSRANLNNTITWQPGAGFCTVTMDATSVVTPCISTHVPLRSGVRFENKPSGECQWSSVNVLGNQAVITAINASREPQEFALCSAESSDTDPSWKLEPVVRFSPTKRGDTLTVGPPVMLQAYAVFGYEQNQLVSPGDRYGYIFATQEGKPDPVDLRTLAVDPTFILYSNNRGGLSLEMLQEQVGDYASSSDDYVDSSRDHPGSFRDLRNPFQDYPVVNPPPMFNITPQEPAYNMVKLPQQLFEPPSAPPLVGPSEHGRPVLVIDPQLGVPGTRPELSRRQDTPIKDPPAETSEHVFEPKNITICTSNHNSSKALVAMTQIVLTVTPVNQFELFVSKIPFAWKVLKFTPQARSEQTCVWQPGIGFCTLNESEKNDKKVSSVAHGAHIRIGYSVKLSYKSGSDSWSEPKMDTRPGEDLVMAINGTQTTVAIALCSVDDSSGDWKYELFLHCGEITPRRCVTLGPPVMLQAYAVHGYKQNQLLSKEDKGNYLFTSGPEREPKPIDLRSLKKNTSFLLARNHRGKLELTRIFDDQV